MNVATGEVIAERIHRNDSAAFTAFLAMLHQMIPPHLRIHLIMDNGSSHTSAATRAWLAARPRFAVTCTPRHASWLNMAEQWFGVLTRRLLRRGEFASRDDLDAKITAFTIQHHKERPPLFMELRRRRLARPLPCPPSPARIRTRPPGSRVTKTPGNRALVSNLRCPGTRASPSPAASSPPPAGRPVVKLDL